MYRESNGSEHGGRGGECHSRTPSRHEVRVVPATSDLHVEIVYGPTPAVADALVLLVSTAATDVLGAPSRALIPPADLDAVIGALVLAQEQLSASGPFAPDAETGRAQAQPRRVSG